MPSILARSTHRFQPRRLGLLGPCILRYAADDSALAALSLAFCAATRAVHEGSGSAYELCCYFKSSNGGQPLGNTTPTPVTRGSNNSLMMEDRALQFSPEALSIPILIAPILKVTARRDLVVATPVLYS
jgi:hypothetical protein